MNYYFVHAGKVDLVSRDRVPDTFLHPALGSISNMSALDVCNLAALGWLAGEPQEEPPHDPELEKCYIVPQAPADLDKWIEEWRAYQKAVHLGEVRDSAIAAPKVLELWVVEPLAPAELEQIKDQRFKQIRWRRDMLLQGTDYMMLLDSPAIPERIDAWKAYRQALRDLPQHTTDPSKVEWPSEPQAPERAK